MSPAMSSVTVGVPRWIFMLAMTLTLAAGGQARAWLVQIDGDTPATDFGRAVALDTAGNSVVAGSVTDLDVGTSITVVKRDADGHELWRRRLGGTLLVSGEGGAEARAVAVDAIGDVFVAGLVADVGTSEDVLVAKLAGATGVELWRVVLDGAGHDYDRPAGIALDAAGNVVVAATLRDAERDDAAVFVKLAGTNGGEVWRTPVHGTANDGHAAGVAMLAGGHVAIAATIGNLGGVGQDWLLARLHGISGVPLAAPAIVHGGMSDEVAAVAVDGDDNIIAAGKLRGAANDDFAVVKVSPTGVELWRRLIAGTGTGTDMASALAVDFHDDVVAAGFRTADTGQRDFFLTKLRSVDGASLWLATIVGSAGLDGRAYAVSVDASAGVVAAGTTNNSGTGSDFTVVRFAGDGTLRWLRALPRAGDDEVAYGVAAGLGGDVAVGTVRDEQSALDFRTMRFGSFSGDIIWQQDDRGTGSSSEDDGVAVAVDARGDVVAAGTTWNTGSTEDLTVVAVDGASGATRWIQHFTGSAPDGSDTPTDVAVDSAGDVLAAGSIQNVGTGRDFTVLKLAHADGAERWRAVLTLYPDHDLPGGANAVAVDAAGDVVAAGGDRDVGDDDRFVVYKLDGATGGTRWTHVGEGRPGGGHNDVAQDVAIDGAGDVVAAGVLDAGGTRADDFAVVKLGGATGEARWHALYHGASIRDRADVVVVDGTGDVIAAGTLGLLPIGAEMLVVKLAGADGAERWQYRLDPGGPERSVSVTAAAVDAAGDVAVVGVLYPDEGVDIGVVAKLSGTHGGELWRAYLSDGAAGGDSTAVGVAFDAAGDVVVFGDVRGAASPSHPAWLLTKLAGATGTPLWSRAMTGTTGAYAGAAALALDAGGNPVVVGTLDDVGTLTDFVVAKVSGRTGGDAFCGDGTRDAGERCDDGNAAGGDCCSATCEPLGVPGVCGAPCSEPAECDDADACTEHACDATSHCANIAVTGTAAVSCRFAGTLHHPQCANVPRRLQRMFARAGRFVERALAASRPAKQHRLYRQASRTLVKVGRLVDRAARSHRASRRIAPECAAALRAMVSDARSRIETASR